MILVDEPISKNNIVVHNLKKTSRRWLVSARGG